MSRVENGAVVVAIMEELAQPTPKLIPEWCGLAEWINPLISESLQKQKLCDPVLQQFGSNMIPFRSSSEPQPDPEILVYSVQLLAASVKVPDKHEEL